MDDLLTVAQVAELVGVGVSAVHKRVQCGRLVALSVPGRGPTGYVLVVERLAAQAWA
jgi:hypothetical protein